MTHEATGYLTFHRGSPYPNGKFYGKFVPDIGRPFQVQGVTTKMLRPDIHVRIKGEMSHGAYGPKMDVAELEIVPDRSAVLKYLTSLKGIGSSTAEKIWDTFGSESLDVITNKPERLSETGLTPAKTEKVLEGFAEESVEKLLRKHIPHLNKAVTQKIVGLYKGNTLATLKSNPYVLCDDMYPDRRFSFNAVDRMALTMGPVDKKSRLNAGIKYALRTLFDDTKHSCLWYGEPRHRAWIEDHVRQAMPGMNLSSREIYDAILAKECPYLMISFIDGETYLVSESTYQAEQSICSSVAGFMGHSPKISLDDDKIDEYIAQFEMATARTMDDSQKNAVRTCLRNRLSIMSGGPGTGKTTTAKCLVFIYAHEMRRMGGFAMVELVAPTHKALAGLKESIREISGRVHFEQRAETVAKHCVSMESENPLYENRLVIIDETSMLSLQQAAKILHIFRNDHVVMLGDVNQLPSIDSGEVLHDLTLCGNVPTSYLTECHRTDSRAISENAASICGSSTVMIKEVPGVFDIYDYPEATDQCLSHIVYEYIKYYDQKQQSDDVVCLTPFKKRSLGTASINYAIRERVNPETSSHSAYGGYGNAYTNGTPVKGSFVEVPERIIQSGVKSSNYRVGDLIVCNTNHMNGKTNEDGDFVDAMYGLRNGTRCRIIAYELVAGKAGEEWKAVIETMAGNNIQYWISPEMLTENFSLGYAMTIHKAQGSEYAHVIYASPPETVRVQDFNCKNMPYTAITRAKESVAIIGSRYALMESVKNFRNPRYSLLPYLLGLPLPTGTQCLPMVCWYDRNRP